MPVTTLCPCHRERGRSFFCSLCLTSGGLTPSPASLIHLPSYDIPPTLALCAVTVHSTTNRTFFLMCRSDWDQNMLYIALFSVRDDKALSNRIFFSEQTSSVLLRPRRKRLQTFFNPRSATFPDGTAGTN